MNYKAPDNSLHVIEPEFAHMLPEGCIAITDEEAEALRPVPPEPTYQQLRAAAYPPATDYLDAIVKGDQEQMQAYIDACLAVKAKYPK
jgi:hypothetical protein